MKVLLVGGSGQLGSDLQKSAPSGISLYAPDRNLLDLEHLERTEQEVLRFAPEVLINTAAFHQLQVCEHEPLRAFAVNCVAVERLARCAKKVGARFITFSTNYVFDGQSASPYVEESRPAPLQIYGLSKLAGEFAAQSAWGPGSWIVRTSGLFGVKGSRARQGNFIEQRVAEAAGSEALEISGEQTTSLTFAEDLARAVWGLLGNSSAAPGIYHLVNEGQCTWAECTQEIYRIIGSKREVRAVDRGGRTGEMRRPLYTVLSNQRARSAGIRLPDWKDALKRFLAHRAAV